MMYRLEIPRWHPASLNKLMHCHWATKNRLKKADRRTVGAYVAQSRIPRAEGRRRVTLTIRLKPRQRAADPDAYWKSLLDSLTAAGAIVDDNRKWVELANVQYERGTAEDWGTTLTLEDMEEFNG